MRTVATLTTARVEAVFEDCGVSCEDASLLERVRLIMAGVPRSPSIPDLDHEHARAACRTLDGEITAYDGPPETVPGRVY